MQILNQPNADFEVPTTNRFHELDVQKCVPIKIKPRLFRCKMGTINVRTASSEDKLMLILRELNKSGMCVVCLQEFRWLNSGEMKMTVDSVDWLIIWSGGTKKQHGVAMCFRMCEKYKNRIEITSFEQISDRLLVVDCSVSGTKLRIISAYAPTNCYTLNQKEAFYENLLKISVISHESKRKILTMGDFNGFVSILNERCCFDGNLEKLDQYDSTESGQLFLDHCFEANLGSLNTFYTHKWHQRCTFYSNDGRTNRVYDHVLAGPWIRKFTTDCRIRNSIKIDSDHRCVVASFAFPAYKRDRVLTKSRKKRQKIRKIDYRELLMNQELNENYIENVENQMNAMDNPSLEELVSILDSETRLIPSKAKRGKVNPWDNDLSLQVLLKDRDRTDRLIHPAKYKELTKNIKKKVQTLRNDFLKVEASKINLAYFNRELEKSYALTKDHRMAENIRIGAKCDEVLMRNHVEKHLNTDTDLSPPAQITTEIPECLKVTSKLTFREPILSEKPSETEFYDAISKLKNNKSSTDIRAECVKVAIESKPFFDALYSAITEVWETREIPDSWRYSQITCIFKNGDRLLPENYRTLSISAVLLKAVMCIILHRSKEWYEASLLDCQNGFRTARGTADSVFCVKNLIRICKSQGKSMYALALDLRAAYDWIKRSWLWLCIAARNCDSEFEEELGDLFALVRSLYGERVPLKVHHCSQFFVILS